MVIIPTKPDGIIGNCVFCRTDAKRTINTFQEQVKSAYTEQDITKLICLCTKLSPWIPLGLKSNKIKEIILLITACSEVKVKQHVRIIFILINNLPTTNKES